MTLADYQPIKGLKREKFPFFPSRDPPTALRSVLQTRFQKGVICRAILALCGDDADVRERIRHAVSVSLTLVNTAVLSVTKSRQESILLGFCALAMSMGGDAEARERRTATAARVCQRRTAAIPPSAARTAGFAVNDDGGQAQ